MNGLAVAYQWSSCRLQLTTGGYGTTKIWDNQVESFAARYEVIRYDLRGYGRSSLGPRTGHSAEAWGVEDLAGLLDVLEVESTALVGLESGADIALKLACVQPKRVQALVLTNATIHDTEVARVVLEGRLALPPPRRFWDEMTSAERRDFQAAGRHVLAMRLWNLLAQRVRAWPDSPYTRYFEARDVDAPLMDQLRYVVAPTLFVHSEWTGRLTGATQDDLLLAKLSVGKKVGVPRSAMYLPLQPADTYNRIVLDFLAAHYGHE